MPFNNLKNATNKVLREFGFAHPAYVLSIKNSGNKFTVRFTVGDLEQFEFLISKDFNKLHKVIQKEIEKGMNGYRVYNRVGYGTLFGKDLTKTSERLAEHDI